MWKLCKARESVKTEADFPLRLSLRSLWRVILGELGVMRTAAQEEGR